jgi:hypothetical protein
MRSAAVYQPDPWVQEDAEFTWAQTGEDNRRHLVEPLARVSPHALHPKALGGRTTTFTCWAGSKERDTS